LAIKLVYLFTSQSSPFFEPRLLDPKYYHDWALRIAAGDLTSDPVFYGLPLYPFFLALCYKISNSALLSAKLAQIALGLVTLFFTYKTGEKLHGEKTGLVAVALGAVYGPLFFHEGVFIPEALGLPLYAAAFYFLCLLVERISPLRAALFGVTLGLACLTKAGALVFAFMFLAAILFSKGHTLKNKIPALLIFILSFLATLAPVTLHNLIRGKDTVLLTSHAGFNFYIGNNPRAEGVFVAPEGTGSNVEAQKADSQALAERAVGRKLKPSEVSKYWSDQAWEFIRQNPQEFLKLTLKKLALFFDAREISDVEDYGFAGRFNGFLRFPWLDFSVLGPLVFLGLALAGRGLRHRLWVYLWIGCYLAGLAAFFVNARYRLPLLSLFLVLAAFAVIKVIEAFKARQWSTLLASALVLAAAVGLTQARLVGKDPSRDLVNAGDVYLEKKDHDQAVSLYKEAIQLNPRYAKAYQALGVAMTRQGRHEEAKDSYLKALEIEPSSQVYNNLGMWYDRVGELDRAERFFIKALELQPNSPQAHNNLGMICGKKGLYEDAVREFEASIELNPQNARTHTNLGLVLHRMGDDRKAKAHFEKAHAIDPDFEEAKRALSFF